MCQGLGADDFLDRVEKVLKATPLIDGHNDIPWQFRRRVNNDLGQLDLSTDLSLLKNPTQTDIPRLRHGLLGGQFWSVYVPINEYGGTPEHVQQVIEQIDVVYRMTSMYADTFEMAYTAEDIERIHSKGKIASLIGIEGGHAINDSLAVLRRLYQLGARYMTLTHSKSVRWADSATDMVRHEGLSEFGERVIREMNRLGMMVDLSHVSVATMSDALAITEAPVIFSHSSVYQVVPHVRNVPDDILNMVAQNKGVVMVTFFPSYVSEETWMYGVNLERERARLVEKFPAGEVSRMLERWRRENPAPRPTLYQVADHIDHIKTIVGVDYIGIGGDYDGMPAGPIGLDDVSTYPKLFAELLKRGYSEKDLAKIAGKNILRVMRAVEKKAKELSNGPS